MPKVVWSEETLNGQAKICLLDNRTGYYLRIYRKEKRAYSYPSLSTADIEEARKNALNIYVETTKVAPKTRSKKYLLETAVEEYLLERQEDVRNNELSAGSLDTYRQRLSQRILPYALEKGVRNIGDLTNKTWDDYKRFYQSRTTAGRWGQESQGLSAETINSDISTLESFLWWCVHKGYVQPTEIPQKIKRVKQRKKHTEESNPAFFPQDWKTVVNVLENWDVHGIDFNKHRGIEDSIKEWRQELFRWWVCFQYETGCRPHETDLLRFRDIEEIKDENGNKKLLITISEKTKTGRRECVAPYYLLDGIKRHKRAGLGLLAKKNEEHNQRVKARWEKGVKRKADRLKEEVLDYEPLSSDLLFFNVFTQKGTRTNYSTTWYEEQWEALLVEAMKTPSFPQDCIHTYTMYSLRSTHITHELLRGVDIEILSDNVGNSPSVIRSNYKRPIQRLNAKYLANSEEALRQLDDGEVMSSLHKQIVDQATAKLLEQFPRLN